MDTSLAGAFVGRRPEIASGHELLSQVIHGRGRALLIDGEPGIGKSALLAVLLRMARSCGCTVLLGHADDMSQQLAMRVMLDCLRSAAGQTGAHPVAAAVPSTEQLMLSSSLLPAGLPDQSADSFPEQVLTQVRDLCAQSPVVLAIDDLHWADDDSLLAWRRLAGMAPDLPVLLVATCSTVPDRTELTALKRELEVRDQAVVSLGPLDREEISELVSVLAGGNPTGRLRRLAERAGGNPLYVTELVDALRRSKRLRVMDGTADLVTSQEPETVAATISERLNFLSAETSRVLRFAALLGRDFTAAEVAVAASLTPHGLKPALAEAQAAQVLEEADGQLHFRHLLIRQALYENMPGALRLALHRQAAQALAAAGAPDERVIEQLLATNQLAANSWIQEWLAEAAPRLAQRVPQMAAELFRRLLLDASPEDPQRDLLDRALATALLRQSRPREAVDVARPLLARTTEPQQRAETVRVLGYALLGCNRTSEALRLVEQVLAEPAVSPGWRARLRSVAALIRALGGRLDEADRTAQLALAEGQHAGDSYAVGQALHVLSLVSMHRSENVAVEKLTTQALGVLDDDLETAELRCTLLLNRMLGLQQLGRIAEAGLDLRAAQHLDSQGAVSVALAHAAAEYYLRVGRWDEALDQLDSVTRILSLARPPDLAVHDPVKHGISALIAAHRDDRAALQAHLKAASGRAWSACGLEPPGQLAYLTMARAMAAERDGQPAEAVAVLRACLDTDDAASLRLRGLCLPTLTRLALECGDAGLAAAARDTAEQADRQETTVIRRAGAKHCRGLIARDPVPLLAATQTYRDIGVLLEYALAAEDAAESLAAAQQPSHARRVLTEATDAYANMGADWDIRRADSRLRRYGIRRGRGRSRNSASGWDSLTSTEATIAQLISRGGSTSDIAADLLLSPRTVQTHVSHILRKLGGRSRVDIVRAGLVAGAAAADPQPGRLAP